MAGIKLPPIMPESRVYGLFASLSARTGVACEPPVEGKRPFSNGLKEVGFEDQLQLARCFRINLPKLGLEILPVGDAFQFVRCARCSFRCVWRCTGSQLTFSWKSRAKPHCSYLIHAPESV